MKCISYKNIMNYLEKIKISNISHIDLNLEKIFIYERRIAKAMKIEKCFTSACCLFKTLRQLGYRPNLCIGIMKNKSFESHAWIEVDNYKFLYKPRYKIIEKI